MRESSTKSSSLQVGDAFGSLVIVNIIRKQSSSNPRRIRLYADCRCTCNAVQCKREVVVRADHLLIGATTSCGKLGAKFRHGHSGQNAINRNEFRAWEGMFWRCDNPKHKYYAMYGGRGITICQRWRESFDAFLADMGQRPEGCTLDRIDVNGNYEQANCRWTSWKTQQRNKRNNKMITFQNETKCVAEWAEITGIPKQVLYGRLRLEWSVERALTTPYRFGAAALRAPTHVP